MLLRKTVTVNDLVSLRKRVPHSLRTRKAHSYTPLIVLSPVVAGNLRCALICTRARPAMEAPSVL